MRQRVVRQLRLWRLVLLFTAAVLAYWAFTHQAQASSDGEILWQAVKDFARGVWHIITAIFGILVDAFTTTF